MKKLKIEILCIVMALLFSGVPVTAEDQVSLDVIVEDTGMVDFIVKIEDPNLDSKYTEVRVVKEGDVIPENVQELPANPIYWHYAWDGAPLWCRIDTPGTYCAYLLRVMNKVTVLAGPVEFEVPEVKVTPAPTPTESPATPTPDPTLSPTVKMTADITATPTAAATPGAATDSAASGRNNDLLVWICLGAAALVIVIIITVMLRRKRK